MQTVVATNIYSQLLYYAEMTIWCKLVYENH